jgi:hypothetical protein
MANENDQTLTETILTTDAAPAQGASEEITTAHAAAQADQERKAQATAREKVISEGQAAVQSILKAVASEDRKVFRAVVRGLKIKEGRWGHRVARLATSIGLDNIMSKNDQIGALLDVRSCLYPTDYENVKPLVAGSMQAGNRDLAQKILQDSQESMAEVDLIRAALLPGDSEVMKTDPVLRSHKRRDFAHVPRTPRHGGWAPPNYKNPAIRMGLMISKAERNGLQFTPSSKEEFVLSLLRLSVVDTAGHVTPPAP